MDKQQTKEILALAHTINDRAPDISSPSHYNNPPGNIFRVAERMLTVRDTSYPPYVQFRLRPGDAFVYVSGDAEVNEGQLKIRDSSSQRNNPQQRTPYHRESRAVALPKFNAALSYVERGNDAGLYSVISQRRLLVGERPAIAEVRTVKEAAKGKPMKPFGASIGVYRTMPNSRRLLQRVNLSASNGAVQEIDTTCILGPAEDFPEVRGNYHEAKADRARSIGARVLVDDDRLPIRQPLHYEHLLYILGVR